MRQRRGERVTRRQRSRPQQSENAGVPTQQSSYGRLFVGFIVLLSLVFLVTRMRKQPEDWEAVSNGELAQAPRLPGELTEFDSNAQLRQVVDMGKFAWVLSQVRDRGAANLDGIPNEDFDFYQAFFETLRVAKGRLSATLTAADVKKTSDPDVVEFRSIENGYLLEMLQVMNPFVVMDMFASGLTVTVVRKEELGGVDATFDGGNRKIYLSTSRVDLGEKIANEAQHAAISLHNQREQPGIDVYREALFVRGIEHYQPMLRYGFGRLRRLFRQAIKVKQAGGTLQSLVEFQELMELCVNYRPRAHSIVLSPAALAGAITEEAKIGRNRYLVRPLAEERANGDMVAAYFPQVLSVKSHADGSQEYFIESCYGSSEEARAQAFLIDMVRIDNRYRPGEHYSAEHRPEMFKDIRSTLLERLSDLQILVKKAPMALNEYFPDFCKGLSKQFNVKDYCSIPKL